MSTSIITKPKAIIDPSILKKLEELTQQEGQVLVHCICNNQSNWSTKIRIWESTYLLDHNSSYRSELVHAENISFYPEWQRIPANTRAHFSLVFSSLPKICNSFDLEEIIPEPGGFVVRNIQRNNLDVYFVAF